MDFDIWDILAAEFNHERLTDEERMFLQRWLAAGREHELIYCRLKDFYELYHTGRIDTDSAYRNVLQGLKQKRKRRLLRYWSSVAAAVVVALAGCLMYVLNNSSVPQPVVCESGISAGSSKAVLTLASGKSMVLDSTTNMEIRTENGIINNRNKTLCFIPEHIAGGHSEQRYNKLNIPRGGEYQIVLEDGTKVWLNSETEFRFPEVFSETERRVYLSGEAFFEVTKNDTCPFIVQVDGMEVTVLGTEFNITAYQGENIYTTLVKGSVKVAGGDDYRVLSPSEQAVYHVTGREMTVREVNTSLYTSWHEGYYTFQKENLSEIMHTLSRWYDMNVFFEFQHAQFLHFSGRVKRYEEIREVLELLSLTNDVEFEIKGKNVFVKRK